MYKCLKKNVFTIGDYQIAPVQLEDIQLIREWRNAQLDILRQAEPITPEKQELYYQKQVWPLREALHPTQLLFSFFLHKALIGYGGLTHIDWDAHHAEVSFLVQPERVKDVPAYQTDFTQFLNLLSRMAFDDLCLHRLFTETYAFRLEHMYILEEFGFKREGVLREHAYKRGEWCDSIMHGFLVEEWSYAK